MSKIRNLFKKFKKNKSNEDITGDIEVSEFLDEADQDITVFSDEDASEDIEPMTTEIEDQTGEINISDITSDIEIDNINNEPSGTIDLDNDKVPIKDKVQDALDNIKTSLQNISLSRPKKMSIKKNDHIKSKSAVDSKFKLPPAIKKYEENIKNKITHLNVKNYHNEFFLSKHRQKIHRGFQILLVTTIIYTAGKFTGLLIKGTKDYKAITSGTDISIENESELTKKKIAEHKSANLFKTQAKIVQDTPTKKTVVKTDTTCSKATKKSSLPIKLVNTIVAQDSVKSIASVQVRSSNKLIEFRQGEKINNLAQLDRIERLKLIVKNLKDGSCESIESEAARERISSPINVLSSTESKRFKKAQKKIKGIENDGNSFTIDKTLIAQKMENIQDILTQARGIQITNPDGTLSFKIVDIQPGGVFSYLGIENGDIITQINGQPISDLNMIMGLFGKITNLDKLNITINRGGTPTPLDYKFK